MSRKRSFVSVLAVCFVLASAAPTHAFAKEKAAEKEEKDDGVAAGLKFGLEKSVGQLASMGYKINCRAKDLDYKSDDSWYCGLFAALSDEKEKEFKDRMLHNMEKIRGSLANIETGIAQIQEQQREIYDLNKLILLKLDEVGPETTIGRNVSHIRTVYDEQFSRMFRNPEKGSTQPTSLDRERMRAFARQVIFKDRMENLLGVINDQLVRSQVGGKEPLLRAYARRAFEQIKNDPARGLEPAYVYLESTVDSLLADQRKGYILYVWAAETLQSDCEVATTAGASGNITAEQVTARCKPFHDLPHTALEYRATFAEHVRAQLNELNAGLEYQVLAASNSHARQANFIIPAAEPLFRRVDLFTAANTGDALGIRGRVIAMGDRFDGRLLIAGEPHTPSGATNTVTNREGRTDWWKGSKRGVYDQVHFSDQWKIYHYRVPSAAAGTYSIDTWLPHRPQISVANVTLGTGDTQTTVPFGSFTAIERAGGGYALLSGEWDHVKKDEIKWVGELKEGRNDFFLDATNTRAGMLYTGDLIWQASSAPKDQYIDVNKYSYARSRKLIRNPKGGELTLHAKFGDTLKKVCGDSACADFDHNQVLSRILSLSKPLFGGRSAEVTVRAALLIDNHGDSGSNGFVWEKSGNTDSGFSDRLTAGTESKRIRLDDSGTHIHFGGGVKMNAQTSTTSDTRWMLFGLIFIDNAYLTE